MWLATTRGFYSAVQNRDDHDSIMVRARSRDDLAHLTGLAEQLNQPIGRIINTIEADYPYRLTITRASWQVLLVALADEITYDNFKDAVAVENPYRSHRIYLRVWSALRDIENEPNAAARKKAMR